MSADDERDPIAASGEGYADSAGVRIYYQTFGEDTNADATQQPLMLCLHGFPDDHRTWRPILPALAERFFVVTPDLRGYAKSDKPDGVDNYRMQKLVGDVIALMEHFRRKTMILIGHDWGAAIAQNVAIHFPRRVERLILLNMPHLNGIQRELAMNRRQQAASAYARLAQNELPLGPFDFDVLRRQLRGGRGLRGTFDVLAKSSITGMLNYYRANFPRPPYRFDGGPPRSIITMPTLILFGLDDPFVLADGLRDNGRWFREPLKVVTVPRAGHWVHHDEPDLVAGTILLWLGA
ncbi:MAG: epoxide hydrolase 4 [Phycisphaerales bacterium]|jgi:pimeloyl-ACP methyl ester carboxylesterase|nr:epoxide hydrolase 4 [Phycisphaerales bacterium]